LAATNADSSTSLIDHTPKLLPHENRRQLDKAAIHASLRLSRGYNPDGLT
jgi:hypothetical protein